MVCVVLLVKDGQLLLNKKHTSHKNVEWRSQNRPEEYIISAFMWRSMHPVDWGMLHHQWLQLIKRNRIIH